MAELADAVLAAVLAEQAKEPPQTPEPPLEVEQAVYHAYEAARTLQKAERMSMVEGQQLITVVMTGLHAARRFIFNISLDSQETQPAHVEVGAKAVTPLAPPQTPEPPASYKDRAAYRASFNVSAPLAPAVKPEPTKCEKPDACVGCLDGINAETQDRILLKLYEITGAPKGRIDGSGCDSGDPVDLTLSEISQAFGYLEDKRDEESSAPLAPAVEPANHIADTSKMVTDPSCPSLDALLKEARDATPSFHLQDRLAAALRAADAARQQAEQEIAMAREAYPSVRMQDHFDDSLLTLVNREVTRGFKLQSRAERAEAEIDAAWFGIAHGYDNIESRAELEQQSKTNGFKYGLAQAVHHIWKRDPNVSALKAEVTRLKDRLFELGRRYAQAERDAGRP